MPRFGKRPFLVLFRPKTRRDYDGIDVFVQVETDTVSHVREPAIYLAGGKDCSS